MHLLFNCINFSSMEIIGNKNEKANITILYK